MNTKMKLLAAMLMASAAWGQERAKWQTREDISASHGGPPGFDLADSVLISGDNVVVGGTVLRAYSKASGELQWENPQPTDSVAVSGASVYAVSGIDSTTRTNAFNAQTGAPLWESAGRDNELAGFVAVNANAVIVSGRGYVGAGVNYSLVRALDPVDGRELWSYRQNRRAGVDEFGGPSVVDGFKVLVLNQSGLGLDAQMVLRCFDARSGNLIWEVVRVGIAASSIAVAPNRLYVVGVTVSNQNAYVAAFETGSGDQLWQDFSLPGSFSHAAVKRNRLSAVGRWGFSLNVLIRTYDAESGVLLWHDETAPEYPAFSDFATGVTMTDNAVYLVGVSGKRETYDEWLVRAYSLERGILQFEDRPNRGLPGAVLARGVAIDSGILFTVGTADTMNPAQRNVDRVIKAYEFGDLEGRASTPSAVTARARVRR